MPTSFIITLKGGVSRGDFKKKIEAKGGKITHEYSLINGFAVEFPNDHIMNLDQDPEVESFEKDGTVTTQ